MINTLRPLTQEQRQAAWLAAQAAVIRAAGGRPNREHFSHTTTSKYPPDCFPLPDSPASSLRSFGHSPVRHRISDLRLGSAQYDGSNGGRVSHRSICRGRAGSLFASTGDAGYFPVSSSTLAGSMGISTTLTLVGNEYISRLAR
jgi:hypothetical protein